MSLGTRSIAIVGRGATLWLAAIALTRAFGQHGVSVTAVELPSSSERRDVYATLPDLVRFHRLLGVEESDLLIRADGSFALGQQFSGWSGGETSFLHAYGSTGDAIAELPFIQFWIKARAAGLPVAFDDFASSAAAARHGRIGLSGAPRPTAYGYHLDALGYERLLRARAVALAVPIIAADPGLTVDADSGMIRSVSAAGQRIVADLYIDATGPEGQLIGAVDPDPQTMAPPTSPCDRLLAANGPTLSPLPLYSRIAAHPAGWIGLFPLAHRTAVVMAYASTAMSDDAAVRLALTSSGLPGIEDLAVAAIPDRARLRPWVGNCIALGSAACHGDPIDAVGLQRDQIGIAHIIALLPIHGDYRIEAGIYNEEVGAHFARLRDFQAAHYRLNGCIGEPFWDAARAAPVSADLEYKIALFAARGMSAQYNHETFNTDSWQTVMIGHGLCPRSYDPQVDTVPDAEVGRQLQRLLRKVRDDVEGMLPHQEARARVLQR